MRRFESDPRLVFLNSEGFEPWVRLREAERQSHPRFVFRPCVIAAGILLGTLARADTGAVTTRKIAEAYNVDHFKDLAAMRFTFNVERGTTTVRRRWSWDIESGKVTCDRDGPAGPFHHEYRQGDLDRGDREKNVKVDRWFVNDQFWFLFPFHLVWDSADLRDEGASPTPIPPGSGARLVVTYPKEGGYTPGDRYDVYYDSDHHIRQWSYHRAAQGKPTLTTTWERETDVGPIRLALERKDGAGQLHLWFSDVAVRLKGESSWRRPFNHVLRDFLLNCRPFPS